MVRGPRVVVVEEGEVLPLCLVDTGVSGHGNATRGPLDRSYTWVGDLRWVEVITRGEKQYFARLRTAERRREGVPEVNRVAAGRQDHAYVAGHGRMMPRSALPVDSFRLGSSGSSRGHIDEATVAGLS